ncbi:MAG TPA: sulfite exporter TauE/SafE family protein [bacterium]
MAEIGNYLLLAVVGAVSGFLNVTAGGGSLLTLPLLIFLGLPAATANGTNRIAILIQNIFATVRFHQFKVIPRGVTLITAIPAIFGALVGAQLALNIDELLFKRILALTLVVVLGPMFFGLGPKPVESTFTLSLAKKVFLSAAFFGVGIYGGFIQGAVGFLIILALTLAGYDLVRTNALKVLIVLIFTPFALFIFIVNGQVDYLKGFILAAGSAIGAWLATRVVVEKGHNFIRWLVIVTMVAFAAKLFLD